MPPRFLAQPSLKAFSGSSYIQSPLAALSLNPSKTSIRAGSAESRERRRHDPFLTAQARRRKAANLSRQEVLSKEREGSLGDPVESRQTAFIQDLKDTQAGHQVPSGSETKFNYFVESEDLQHMLEYSKNLTAPIENLDRNTADPQLEKELAQKHMEDHKNAVEAINRIVSVNNGNTQDKMRLNIQKCIEQFGRHTTDQKLPPRPAAPSQQSGTAALEKTPRVGPDTGSPEVQVAILTAKILNLTRHLEGSNKDKHNKRNLRLLVHKRQKMLKYVRRKERGGPRWQHLVESLGLSDAAWKGEISM